MKTSFFLPTSSKLIELYDFRNFILGSVKREFASRYINSMLGATWLVIQPFALILVYTLVFSQVMGVRLPGGAQSAFDFSIFLCAGLLTWGLFANIVSRSQTMFIDNANLLKKINFPRACIPIIVVINATIEFVIIFTLFTGFLILSGTLKGAVFFTIFPVLLLQILFASGLGLLIGILNVFFRDAGQVFSIIMQFWFWLTPIIYPITILPVWGQKIVMFNPMTPFALTYQNILSQGIAPSLNILWPTILVTALLYVLAVRLFLAKSDEMVDEL